MEHVSGSQYISLRVVDPIGLIVVVIFKTTKAEFMELSEEIEILKRVRHPNIIQFHDCWYNNMEFVFITELMTSGTLRE